MMKIPFLSSPKPVQFRNVSPFDTMIYSRRRIWGTIYRKAILIFLVISCIMFLVPFGRIVSAKLAIDKTNKESVEINRIIRNFPSISGEADTSGKNVFQMWKKLPTGNEILSFFSDMLSSFDDIPRSYAGVTQKDDTIIFHIMVTIGPDAPASIRNKFYRIVSSLESKGLTVSVESAPKRADGLIVSIQTTISSFKTDNSRSLSRGEM